MAQPGTASVAFILTRPFGCFRREEPCGCVCRGAFAAIRARRLRSSGSSRVSHAATHWGRGELAALRATNCALAVAGCGAAVLRCCCAAVPWPPLRVPSPRYAAWARAELVENRCLATDDCIFALYADGRPSLRHQSIAHQRTARPRATSQPAPFERQESRGSHRRTGFPLRAALAVNRRRSRRLGTRPRAVVCVHRPLLLLFAPADASTLRQSTPKTDGEMKRCRKKQQCHVTAPSPVLRDLHARGACLDRPAAAPLSQQIALFHL